MPELSWREAIITVLKKNGEPMHYTDIAEAIAGEGLRSEFGATPAASVNAAITVSLRDEGDTSPFVRDGKGYYALRPHLASLRKTVQPVAGSQPTDADIENTGLINAFGMFWSRSSVLWSVKPKILGQQQSGSKPVDFFDQRGVYLLHDGRSVVYVGRTTDQPLGVRLRQHLTDRLNGRWNRFSWFGIYPVKNDGALDSAAVGDFSADALIVTMEALLIEGLEPPQNRKRGDDFRAVEFLQVEDPELQKRQILALMDELKAKL